MLVLQQYDVWCPGPGLVYGRNGKLEQIGHFSEIPISLRITHYN